MAHRFCQNSEGVPQMMTLARIAPPFDSAQGKLRSLVASLTLGRPFDFAQGFGSG
jgi:hypothetical protein